MLCFPFILLLLPLAHSRSECIRNVLYCPVIFIFIFIAVPSSVAQQRQNTTTTTTKKENFNLADCRWVVNERALCTRTYDSEYEDETMRRGRKRRKTKNEKTKEKNEHDLMSLWLPLVACVCVRSNALMWPVLASLSREFQELFSFKKFTENKKNDGDERRERNTRIHRRAGKQKEESPPSKCVASCSAL